MAKQPAAIPSDVIERSILMIRGEKVMLDADLARMYGVPTKALVQAVKRNLDRFPADFLFQLTAEEAEALRSQFVTSKTRGGRRYLPYAFTEHGVAMLASVLRSPQAVEVSVYIVRAFVRLRALAAAHKELAAKLADLERKVSGHDDAIRQLVQAIRQLMTPPAEAPKGRIGFVSSLAKEKGL